MEGGCHCRAVRFHVTGNPSWVGTCYCSDCRKISGTPSMTFAEFEDADFAILSGVPQEYQSSKEALRFFCGHCGSPVAYKNSNYPGKIELPVGAFDDPSPLKPEVHIWVSQKPSWVVINDDLPQQEQ